MIGRGIARNMQSFVLEYIWEISASVGFIIKKFVTMRGHVNVKCDFASIWLKTCHTCRNFGTLACLTFLASFAGNECNNLKAFP